jgi:uncharacterized membrane protein
MGDDVYREYYFFQTTLNNLHWNIIGYSTLDTCLAISLLPTIYQSILNISPEYLYKILYSLLCSVFPVIIYIISKKYIKEGYAFLASIYFMCNVTFLWTGYNSRANLAMLFFAFAMMTLFNDRIEPLKKRILFIMFMASCMVSHYSTTYIFFFVMLGTFIGIEILSKKYTFKKVISLTLIVLFFAMIFFWYSQVTEAAFNQGVYFIKSTIHSLNNFFVEESRSTQAQTLLGKGDVLQESIVYRIHWLLTWITFAFIGIGIVTLIRRYKEMSFPELKFEKLDFLKNKFEVGYFVIVLACVGLLVVILALPYVSEGYGLGRSYPLASTILSVFFVIGGITLAKHFFFFKKKTCAKRKSIDQTASHNSFRKSRDGKNSWEVLAYLIILLVLIPYFLCVTGPMYNIFGVKHVITLNPDYGNWILHDQEYYSGKWLKNNADQRNKIYSDSIISHMLLTYTIRSIRVREIKSIEFEKKSYVCLRYHKSIIKDKTELLNTFDEKNWLYDNGGAGIWR